MKKEFTQSYQSYGYRRIYSALKRQGIVVSEKVIRRIMRQENLIVICIRRKKYSSYAGEVSPAVPNLVQRNFHADKPNQLWLTFEELAVLFEGSTASGAERAYRKAVEHLVCLLTEAGILHMIRLNRKSQTRHKKKIAAAVYLYQVDNDGEWGEISFDFETGTAEIIQLAEWDTTSANDFPKSLFHTC